MIVSAMLQTQIGFATFKPAKQPMFLRTVLFSDYCFNNIYR